MLPLDLILLDPALDGQRMLDAAAWGNVPGPDFNIRAWLRQHEERPSALEIESHLGGPDEGWAGWKCGVWEHRRSLATWDVRPCLS